MKPQNSEPQPRAASQPPAAPTSAPEPRRIAETPPTTGQARANFPPPRPTTAPAEDRNLLSERANAAVSGAFGTLTHTILAQHARTLDDLVAEMLRPMLKEWLDDNLPSLVERLVKEEIERVSRGRR